MSDVTQQLDDGRESKTAIPWLRVFVEGVVTVGSILPEIDQLCRPPAEPGDAGTVGAGTSALALFAYDPQSQS